MSATLENARKTVRRFVAPTRRADASTPVSASIATRRNQPGVKTVGDLESRRSRTVALLVQPERDDRDMYAEFLEHEGLVALCVSDPIHALAIAPHADIVITGLLLPGEFDGFELVARLKHDERTKDIPVVVLTACAWDTERERALQAGCDLFLPKPCLPDALLDNVCRMVKCRRPRHSG
jgi:two-component system cell cycle response regulator DivK